MPYAAFYPNCDVLTAPTVEDLAKLAADPKLPGLILFTYPFETLRELEVLSGYLQILKIQGAPQLKSLEGIQALTKLEELVLATPTGSSGSGRFIAVESFAPIEGLRCLKKLILQEVRPADLDLAPIMRMTQLEDVDIDGVPEFQLEHYARLAQALSNAKGRCLAPYVIIPGIGRCKKCQGQEVLLVGTPPRARRWVCPKCNAKLFAAHVGKWEGLTGKAYERAE